MATTNYAVLHVESSRMVNLNYGTSEFYIIENVTIIRSRAIETLDKIQKKYPKEEYILVTLKGVITNGK